MDFCYQANLNLKLSPLITSNVALGKLLDFSEPDLFDSPVLYL